MPSNFCKNKYYNTKLYNLKFLDVSEQALRLIIISIIINSVISIKCLVLFILFVFYSETIFGYRDLKVKLYYSAGCLETYAGIEYAEKLKESNNQNVKPDDVFRMLSSVLSSGIHYNLDTFISSLVKDDTFVPAGNLVHAFSVQGKYNPSISSTTSITTQNISIVVQLL